MRRDESCKVVCRTKLSAEAAKNFREKIDDEYRVNMYVLILKFLLYCQLINMTVPRQKRINMTV
uniref:Uncharacterized protein n=1 Tax=Aegilops tauschii subsp. strangulata TaxID=200361 RepID=A0A453SCU3_AEGTS